MWVIKVFILKHSFKKLYTKDMYTIVCIISYNERSGFPREMLLLKSVSYVHVMADVADVVMLNFSVGGHNIIIDKLPTILTKDGNVNPGSNHT